MYVYFVSEHAYYEIKMKFFCILKQALSYQYLFKVADHSAI